MKILLMCAYFLPIQEGGAERQCRLQATELARRGHEVTVLTPWREWRMLRRERMQGFQIVRLGFFFPLVKWGWKWREILSGRTPEEYIGGEFVDEVATGRIPVPQRRFRIMPLFENLAQASYRLECFFFSRRKSHRQDVIHVHADTVDWVGLGMQMGKRWQAPVFCKPTTVPLNVPEWGAVPFVVEAKSGRHSLRYVAITKEVREALIEGGVASDAIIDLPNGVVMPGNTPLNSVPIVLTVANLSQGMRAKAFDVLLAAWAQVCQRRPDAQLHFVGGGDAAPWQKLARELGCEHNVHFVGRLADPAAAYRLAMIFVLPSRREGLSNALLEAQSHGLPCVVSDLRANTEIVRHRVNGLVVPVGDADALADSILNLLGDADLRAQLGAAARKRMQAEFSVGHVVDRLEKIYQQEMKGDRS